MPNLKKKVIAPYLVMLLLLLTLGSCSSNRYREYVIIGAREKVSLPELGIKNFFAKVDSGAKTSSLHATSVHEYKKDGEKYIQFQTINQKTCHAKLLEYREIKSSNGEVQKRAVIKTLLKLKNKVWPVEITLSERSKMKFPMLIGRSSLRDKFLIDVKK